MLVCPVPSFDPWMFTLTSKRVAESITEGGFVELEEMAEKMGFDVEVGRSEV